MKLWKALFPPSLNHKGETIDATNILPEYFFISIPLFNDRLEKEIDDWLYVVKHDDVPAVFHSPYMKKVADKLSVLKMTPQERHDYYYLKQVYDDRDELQAGIQVAIEEEKQRSLAAIQEEKKNTARRMLQESMDVQKISKITRLTGDEINDL